MSNCSTKADLKNTASVYLSEFAKKIDKNLIDKNFKSDADKNRYW